MGKKSWIANFFENLTINKGVSLKSHKNAKNCMNFETLFFIHIIEMTMYKEVSLKSHVLRKSTLLHLLFDLVFGKCFLV